MLKPGTRLKVMLKAFGYGSTDAELGRWLRGLLVPVVGNVCMDMSMLDVNDIPGAAAGDRVEVFGIHTTVGDLAKQCGTIPYEIMTGISQRV